MPTVLAAARALSKGHITGRSARAQHRQKDWPQRARSALATGLTAARALSTGNRTGRSARALYRAQLHRALSAQAIALAASRALHRPQNWPQRARSAQATELAASRALFTGHRTGRSARAHHRPQKWTQRARSATYGNVHNWQQRARAQHWLHNIYEYISKLIYEYIRVQSAVLMTQ